MTKEEEKQNSLFDKGEGWEEAWKGMPEFVQQDLAPFKTIYVYFENRKDMDEFSRLVDQRITLDTRSIWFPEAEIGRISNKRYVDSAAPPPPAPESADDPEPEEIPEDDECPF